MASAITALSTITVSNSPSSVTFSNIPSSYRDLYIQVSGTTSSVQQISLIFNSDGTGGNYNWTQVGADPGSGLFGVGLVSSDRVRMGYSGTGASSHFAHIFEYSQSKYKEIITRSSTATTDVRLVGGQWRSTATISTVKVQVDAGNFVNGAKISLYGVST